MRRHCFYFSSKSSVPVNSKKRIALGVSHGFPRSNRTRNTRSGLTRPLTRPITKLLRHRSANLSIGILGCFLLATKTLIMLFGYELKSITPKTPHLLQKMMDVNAVGSVRVMKAFIPMLRESAGRIVIVASLSGKPST